MKADGITRRRRGDGSIAYQARPIIRGRRLPAKTFDTLREARSYKRQAEERLYGGRATRETCDTFALRWPDEYVIVKQGPTRGRLKSEATRSHYRAHLKPFIEEFRGVPLADVDRPTARRFATKQPKSASVARSLFSDAVEDQLVAANPFAGLRLKQSRGRSDHEALSVEELHDLAEIALAVHGPEYGPIFRAFILFSGYVGTRLNEGCSLEWPDIRLGDQEVHVRIAKFDKPRTVLLLPAAAEALRSMPRRADTPFVFTSKRGRPLTKTSHFAIWNPVRAAFWASLPGARRKQVVDLDWHSLRHFTGHHFYITLGYGSELAAYQLGHADPSLIERRYGKPYQGALERLKRGVARPTVVPLEEARGASGLL